MTMTEAAALALLKEEGLPTEGMKLRPLPGGFAALVKGPEPELAVLTQGQQTFDKLWAGGSSKKKGLRRLPLNSNNAALVRRFVPGCAPKALGPEGTALGFTDLLGCDLSPAAALLAEAKDLQPFWVDVKAEDCAAWDTTLIAAADRATWGALAAADGKSYGAAVVVDKEEDLVKALLYGYSSIGFDLKGEVDLGVAELSAAETNERYEKLPELFRSALTASYLQSEFDAEGFKLRYEENELKRIILGYGRALMHSQYIYETYLQGSPWPLDYEADFSKVPLSPAAHYLLAKEWERNSVKVTCLTLDAARFESCPDVLEAHCRIAAFFGHRLGLLHADTALADPKKVRSLLKEKVHFKLSSLIFKAVLKTMEEKEPALAEKICRALSDGSEKTVADLSPSAIKEHEKILGAQSEMKAALKNFAAQNKEACAAMLGELTASFVKKL